MGCTKLEAVADIANITVIPRNSETHHTMRTRCSCKSGEILSIQGPRNDTKTGVENHITIYTCSLSRSIDSMYKVLPEVFLQHHEFEIVGSALNARTSSMIDTLRSRRRRSDTVPHRVQIQLSTRCLVRDRAGGYPAARTGPVDRGWPSTAEAGLSSQLHTSVYREVE